MSTPTPLTTMPKRKHSSESESVHKPESAPSASQTKDEYPDMVFPGKFYGDDESIAIENKLNQLEREKPDKVDSKKDFEVNDHLNARICKEYGIDALVQVGKGGFGTVFSCNETKTKLSSSKKAKYPETSKSKKRAIKLIPFRYESNGQYKLYLRQVKRELDITRKLKDNPSIIRLLNFKFIDEPRCFVLKTEWLDCSLQNVIDNYGVLESKELFGQIAGPIISAIAKIHEQFIVHHDIKPSNIMLHPFDLTKPLGSQLATCQKKIIDFGVSRYYPGLAPRTARIKFHRAGTRFYFSPEKKYQEGYREYNPYLADSYALGLTLLAMLILHAQIVEEREDKIDANGCITNGKTVQEIAEDFRDKAGNVFKREHLNAIVQLVADSPNKRIHPKDALKLFEC